MLACRVALSCLPLALALSGCAILDDEPFADPPPASVELIDDPVPLAWEAVITPEDRGRLERLEEAWAAGLEQARANGFRRAVRDAGPLLDPQAALPRAAPPPGPYRCRMITLGAKGDGPAFAAFRSFQCYVEAEGELLTMVKQTGTQRPAGRLWAERDDRMIFLGGLALNGEDAAPPYGESAERSVAGYVERVEPFRWRLVIPWPMTDSLLDVIEFVPMAPELPEP